MNVSMGDDTRSQLLKIIEGALIAVVALLVAIIVGRILVLSFGFFDVENIFIQIPLEIVMVQGVTFGGVTLVYLYLRNLGLEFLNIRMPSLRDIVWIVFGFGLLLGIVMVIGFIIQQTGVESARNVIQERAENAPEAFLLLIPLSFLLIGPGEELLFRGLIQGSMREVFGPIAAIGLASVIFAIIHFPSLTVQGSQFVYIFVVFGLSLVLGTAYERTDNLVVPAVIHGTYNALQFLLLYLVTTGLLPMG